MHRPADIQRKCLDPLRQLLNDPSLNVAVERIKSDRAIRPPFLSDDTTLDSIKVFQNELDYSRLVAEAGATSVLAEVAVEAVWSLRSHEDRHFG
jgi:hypothetical protein